MSGFHLVPVEGGETIHLPAGETVLGRGPFLRVGDKRVSRHHGLLENLDGRLRLKPTHVNPCFFQSSLSDDPRPLQKDAWFSLQDGDLFSLLPGQLIYRVVAVGDGASSSRRGEEELPVSPKPDVEPLPAQTPPPEEPTEAPPPQQDQVSPLPAVNNLGERSSEATPRQRVLPAWMMAVVMAPGDTKDQRAAASRRTPAKKPKSSSAEEEEEEKLKRRRSDDEEPQDLPPGPESDRADLSGGSDGFSEEADEEGRGGAMAAAAAAEHQHQDRKLKKSRTAESDNGSSSTTRTPCPYGKECYRKNPLHFQECSHPGDADYEEQEEEEEEEEEEEGRPECPYGTDCYRKNPLHRKEYKHTRRPAYNTRPRRANAAAADPEEDLEDDNSFINDDSEDGGDDSDYAPPDSEDSGKEDMRRLQKEAQAFLRRK